MQQIDLQYILKSGLVHLYVLGLASPEECARVEEWKTRFPELEDIIEQSRAALKRHMAEELASRIPTKAEIKP